MGAENGVKLTEDQIDDLIYYARANDLEGLSTALSEELCGQQEGRAGAADILAQAVDAESGNTPLHMAAANGYEDIVKYTLSLYLPSKTTTTNTDTTTSTSTSSSTPTPPNPSAQSQPTVSSPTPSSKSPSPLPLTHPINHTNSSGNTALHWASLNGHLTCVRLLADSGADLSIENNARHDALDEAERAGKADVARFLLARMSGKTEAEIVEAAEGDGDGEEEGKEGGVRVTQEQLERLGLEEKENEKGKGKQSEG